MEICGENAILARFAAANVNKLVTNKSKEILHDQLAQEAAKDSKAIRAAMCWYRMLVNRPSSTTWSKNVAQTETAPA